MDKNAILAILNDWNFWNQSLRTGTARPLYVKRLEKFLATDMVIAISGPRRAGKSYIMRQMIENLIAKGVSPKQTLMINFEDPRWPFLSIELLQNIYRVYREAFQFTETPTIFLDEVQEVEGWEKWVNTMHELGRAKIVVSGSNAKLLSRELSTLLTGRHLTLEVFPLSFAEHTAFLKGGASSTPDIHNILEFGAFPEVVCSSQKKEILLNYFNDLLFKDIIKRYAIRKQEDLKSLARFYLGQTASLITHNSTKKFLDLSTSTIEKFSSYFEDAYLTFFLKRFSFKTREQEKSPRKLYMIDTGLSHVVGFQQIKILGRLAENYVFLELLKGKLMQPDREIFYWKDPQQSYEVDFIVRQGLQVTQAIQVCWQLENPKTLERETRALWKVMEVFGLKESTIVTFDEERVEKKGNKLIQVVPIEKWYKFT